jgi:hypothetical protein
MHTCISETDYDWLNHKCQCEEAEAMQLEAAPSYSSVQLMEPPSDPTHRHSLSFLAKDEASTE